MPIIVELESVLLDRGMMLTQLQKKVGLTLANLSILKTGKGKAVRFSTLEKICEALDCQPGDILRYEGKIPGRKHHAKPAAEADASAPEPAKPKAVGKPGRKPQPIVPLKMKPAGPTPDDILKSDGEPELPLTPIWPEK